MSEQTLFLMVASTILVLVIVIGIIKLIRMYERANALESAILAVIRFGGEYGEMLSKAMLNGGIDRSELASEDEIICKHLEEVGFLSEFPGKWVLSGSGEAALKTVSPDLVNQYAQVK